MKTPIMLALATGSALSNSANRFVAFANGPGMSQALQTTSARARTPIAKAGTIKTLVARFPTAVTTGSYVLTLLKNGSSTALTVTVNSSSGLIVSDLSNAVSVAAGDDVCWQVVPSGTPEAQATPVHISCIFESTAAGDCVLFSTTTNSAAAAYIGVGQGGYNATEAIMQAPCAAAGTFDSLYIRLDTAPGTGVSRIYTLRKNGVDTALTVTISDANTSGNMTGASVAVAAGDLLTINAANSGTPASSVANVGLGFRPTIDGETPLFAGLGSPSTSATVYQAASGFGGDATEANVPNIAPEALVLRKLYASVVTAPASGKSRAYTVRKAGASQALTATISNTATTANDTSNSVTVAQNDLINSMTVPSGTPSSTTGSGLGMVAFIDPSGGGGGGGTPLHGLSLLLGVGL